MASTATRRDIEEVVVDALASMGPPREAITPSATFKELDIDSLDLVELLQIAEERFGIPLDAEEVKDITTVRQAIELVAARLRQ